MIKVEENISLANRTTFRVGGPARYLVTAQSVQELEEALKFAREKNLSVFVLGAGSNVIFPDRGYSGLVIKPRLMTVNFRKDKAEVGAGVMMDDLVRKTTKCGWSGLEWAGGLPGTVGGAIRGNAGAYRGEMKDNLLEVRSIEIASGNIRTRNNEQCRFAYRYSVFKEVKEIILSATLAFEVADKGEVEKIAQTHRQQRKERHPLEYPNAGSIFKNISVEQASPAVIEQFKEVIKTDPFPVIPAAAIIARAGLAGACCNHACVSEKHTNFIVNKGKATASDIVSLISLVKKDVQKKYGLNLAVEPEIVS